MRLAVLGSLAFAVFTTPSQAQQMGFVRVVIAKAGLIGGAGGGRGILTYRGRDYPFRVAGLSLGFTVGASVSRLMGEAYPIRNVSDFSGTYTAVGAGGALVGGAGGVHLKNEKGVVITLRGAKAGMELSANLTGVKIALR